MNHPRLSTVVTSRAVAGSTSRKSFCLVALTLISVALSTQAALIGYWKFDEGTGTAAADTSGRAVPLNGTLSAVGTGGSLPLWTSGRFGSGLDFNQGPAISAGGRVSVPNNADLLLPGTFTISFWWRPDYVPAASTFPGIMRIGTQGAGNVGWGYFRSSPNIPVHKRNNHQPTVYSAMTVGAWHHIALTHNGAGANIAYQNGVMVNFTTNWANLTSATVLEFGRMDNFDNAGLDDVGLFNETVSVPKVRSLYTVPTSLSLPYDLAKMRQLWALFDATSSGVVDGTAWDYTTSLPGSTTLGDAYLSGSKWYVVLGAGAGMRGAATLLGDISPAGVGTIGTQAFTETPTIGASARFVFDLGSATTIGGGVNDLYDLTGDLNLSGNTVVINPLAPLATGTYRLINYSGTKSGSFNPVVISNSRYTLALDEATPGQINLTVSGSNGDLRWKSTGSAAWDLSTLNWSNTLSMADDRFYQADTVSFDDTFNFQTNITLSTLVSPSAMTIDSALLNYSFSGSALGGLANGLTKNGASTLNLSSANTFIGPLNLNGGLLRLGNAASLGSSNTGTFIASGATLDLNNQTPATEPVTVAGSGVGGLGAIVNNNAAGSSADALRNVTLSADTTFGGSGRWDLTGLLAGGGFKLTKVGANELWIAPVSGNTGLGDIEVQQGVLGFEGVNFAALGNPASTLTIQSTGTLGFYALNNPASPMEKTVVINSGTWRNDNGNNVFNGPVTLNGNSTFTMGAGATLNQLGVIGGSGNLLKANTGTLVLAGVNTYTGTTLVNGGTLTLVTNGSITGSTGITLTASTILNVAGRIDGTLTLAPGQSLSGSGTVQGSVVSATGASIAPGFSAGTLTVTNALNLSGGATLSFELSGATTEGGGVNDLIIVGGALNLSGTTTVKIIPVGPLVTNVPYTLINYAGALAGGAANLIAISDSRHTFTFDTTTTPGKVLVTAAGDADMLEWTGDAPGAETLWDLNTTVNWLGRDVGKFFFGDAVVFNDFAFGNAVALVGDLYPASVLAENDGVGYVWSGAGRLRGGSLTKINAGKLTIANTGVNDYPGPTTISGGTIQLGNGGTAGNLGPNTITNNATLALNRSDDLAFANTMFGAGTLRKEGGSLLTVGASLAGFSGTLMVDGGTLRPTAATGLGNTTGGVTVNSGGTLDVNALNLGNEVVTARGAGVGGNGAIVNGSATAQTQPLSTVILSGDTTVGGVGRWDIRNPGAGGSLTGNGFTLTKTNANQFSLVGLGDTGLGDVKVQQGVFSAETTTGLGLPSGTVSVQAGATFMLWGNTVIQDKKFALNGAARLFKDNGTATIIGTGTLAGSNAVEVANNAGVDLTLGGVISGSGMINQLGAGNLYLTANNDYSGGTMLTAGRLYLGNGGASGSVEGSITDNTVLTIFRSDVSTLANTVTGSGGMAIRTAAGLIMDGSSSINLGGTISVGQTNTGALIVQPGAVVIANSLFLGDSPAIPGSTLQLGGTVTVTNQLRVGHWPTEVSTYTLGGGNLALTATPAGVVNQGGVAEQAGILYVGIDGIGVFTQTGGVASAHGIVVDARGDTVTISGTNETFNLEGGTFTLGPSGIKTGSLDANTNYQVNLGGGTIASSGSWTSVLKMTFTGANGDTTLDTAANTVRLNGLLSGPGGVKKQGSGTLILQGTNTYAGTTLVNNGTLAGSGTFAGPVVVGPGGTFSPGLSIGTVTVSNSLTLGGTTVMEINKTGAIRTSDLVTGVAALNFGGTLTVLASGDALASGDSFKLFDAATYAGAFTTFNLPSPGPGLGWETCWLNVDGTIRVGLANLPPVVGNDGGSTSKGKPAKFTLAKLLHNDSDPNNDPFAIVAVSAMSTNGGSVTLTSSNVVYTPQMGFTGVDQFTYTVSDGHCGTSTASVEVFVADGDLPSGNQVSLRVAAGSVIVRFAGVPGRSYGIQRATTLSPADWAPLATVTAPIHGIIEYVDSNPPQPTSFYRTILP